MTLLAMAVHTFNPSYLRGRDWKIWGLWQATKLARLHLKNKLKQKGSGA
jgi:hypothetical protein